MERMRTVGRWVAVVGGVLAVLLVPAGATFAALRISGGRQVHSALARLKASGAPTTWQEVIPPPVPYNENAAPLYRKAFARVRLSRSSRQDIKDFLISQGPHAGVLSGELTTFTPAIWQKASTSRR